METQDEIEAHVGTATRSLERALRDQYNELREDTSLTGSLTFALAWLAVFSGSARDTAAYNPLEPQTVANLQLEQARLVGDLERTQRLAFREARLRNVPENLAVGLNRRQVAAVANYRRLLERNSAEALQRELRDRRFDGAVRTARRQGEPLSAERIDRMVDRYAQRQFAERVRTVAQMEAQAAVHSGIDEAHAQAIRRGEIRESSLQDTWHTARDERVRGSHRHMHNQKRPHGQPFISGLGNRLRFPGDPRAPIADRIRCRCSKTTKRIV